MKLLAVLKLLRVVEYLVRVCKGDKNILSVIEIFYYGVVYLRGTSSLIEKRCATLINK